MHTYMHARMHACIHPAGGQLSTPKLKSNIALKCAKYALFGAFSFVLGTFVPVAYPHPYVFLAAEQVPEAQPLEGSRLQGPDHMGSDCMVQVAGSRLACFGLTWLNLALTWLDLA